MLIITAHESSRMRGMHAYYACTLCMHANTFMRQWRLNELFRAGLFQFGTIILPFLNVYIYTAGILFLLKDMHRKTGCIGTVEVNRQTCLK